MMGNDGSIHRNYLYDTSHFMQCMKQTTIIGERKLSARIAKSWATQRFPGKAGPYFIHTRRGLTWTVVTASLYAKRRAREENDGG